MEHNVQDKKSLADAYDKFAHKFNEIYLAGKDRGREAMTVALDKTHQQLTAIGEFSAEHGAELKRYLARDLDQTIADARHLGD